MEVPNYHGDWSRGVFFVARIYWTWGDRVQNLISYCEWKKSCTTSDGWKPINLAYLIYFLGRFLIPLFPNQK